ncbi:hydrolase [Mycobacterium phage JoieB]|uniref:LtfC/p132/Gp6 beta-sandwich domain-containing protein n=3 Tax=Marvinvirus marvin TaxID=1982092 RepID=A0A385UK18_9CAUD|nr:hypothetical protein SEA_VASUNZINGA_60 [Mycobacterium phage VasuNzinga]QFP94199.1 hydrolase [Mycobacterium phage JoieB]QFP96923.1 hydrolase [Mycobacterium phage Pringar]
MALKMLAGTKQITTIQEGSAYKERWTAMPSDPWPAGATARQEFLDSAGGVITELIADEVTANYISFRNPYEDVAAVPNGAGFRCYITDPSEDDLGEQLVRYGTVFRRQLTFPNSPSEQIVYEPKRFTDTFQRPPGRLGGKWVNLLGRPQINSNGTGKPNSVGPDVPFFSRYFTRYYVPFNGDSVLCSISAYRKGTGETLVALCCNSDGSSYLYARFDGDQNKLQLGIGHGTDILFGANLEPVVEDVSLTVPGTSGQPGNYKVRFDEATKEFAFYNDDMTEKLSSWVDEDDLVPHGKGYRYFAIAAQAGLVTSGVQIAYISAANIV